MKAIVVAQMLEHSIGDSSIVVVQRWKVFGHSPTADSDFAVNNAQPVRNSRTGHHQR